MGTLNIRAMTAPRTASDAHSPARSIGTMIASTVRGRRERLRRVVCGGTASTGMVVRRNTCSVVDPKTSFWTPLNPCVPMTMRSLRSRFAVARICEAGLPTATIDVIRSDPPNACAGEPHQLRSTLFDELPLVAVRLARCGEEQRIVDEQHRDPPAEALRDRGRVLKRLSRVHGEIDRAENRSKARSLSPSGHRHNRILRRRRVEVLRPTPIWSWRPRVHARKRPTASISPALPEIRRRSRRMCSPAASAGRSTEQMR